MVRRRSPSEKIRRRAGRDRRGVRAGIGLGLTLLLIGAAWCASRVGSSGAPAASARQQAAGGRGPGAEESLLEEVARHPEDAGARERLGSYYLSSGRPFTALWELQEARALAGEGPEIGLGLANALAAARFRAEAEAALDALLSRHPERTDLALRLAELSLAVGQPERAVAALRRAPDRERSPEALLLLARAYQGLGRREEAERTLQGARRLLPQAWEPAYLLGHLYREQGDLARARVAFLAAGSANPDRPEPHYGLGLLERDTEAGFRAALRRDPEFAPAHRELGILLLRRRQYDAAGEHLLRAIRAAKDPEACRAMAQALAAVGRQIESRYYQGIYFTRKDLRPRAAAAFQEMAALDPGRTEAPLLLTETYIRMNQEHRGIEVIKAALARHPDESALYERLATLYIATIDRPAAARTCREWLKRHPEAATPHWILGRVLIETPQVEEGLRALEAAVAREPENAEFAYTLATALLQRAGPEQEERAVGLLQEAIRKAPGVARYRNQLGLALRRRGDPEGARRQFLHALDLDPHQASVCSNLVSVANQLRRRHQVQFWAPLVRAVEDRTREELQLWRAVWDRPEEPDGYYRLAGFLVRTGELTKARCQLEEGLRLRPEWPEARQLRERLRRLTADGYPERR